ncbi:MAG: hypothetical protein Q8S31_07875 [Alphaproteobacteria bacterium]|nr:hypothetical protein [Alphaproteobacteria bacterium]
MKTMYFNLIIVLFLICFIQENDVLSSPRKGSDVSLDVIETIQKSSERKKDIPLLSLDELLVEPKKIKKKKLVHVDMDNDPWPIFINKKLPVSKWPLKDTEEFKNVPLGSVASFLKLMLGEVYIKKGLVYRAIENGFVFPKGMSELDTLKLLNAAQQQTILDIKFYPSELIDADINYYVKTPIYLYDCIIDEKVVFQFMIWRQNIDCQWDNVGPIMEKIEQKRKDFYPVESIAVLLEYIKDKCHYKKYKMDHDEISLKSRKSLFIENFSKATSSIMECFTPRAEASKESRILSDRTSSDSIVKSPRLKRNISILGYFTPRGDRTKKSGFLSDRDFFVDLSSIQKTEDMSLTPKFEKQKREKLNCLYGSSSSVCGKLEEDDFSSSTLFERGKQKSKKSLSEPISHIENLEDVFPSPTLFKRGK